MYPIHLQGFIDALVICIKRYTGVANLSNYF